MLKRVFALLVICLLLVPIAYAEPISKPENDFFNRHRNDCMYLGRSFVSNSADGFVTLQKEPGSNEEGPKIENGEIVNIEYSCLYKGNFWGFIPSYTNKSSQWQEFCGWVKIDGQLLVLYDYVAFEEDHLGEFYSYKGDFAEIKKTRAAVAWPWPGADSPLWTIEDLDTTNFWVLHAYKDEQGREWGFVTYLFGSPDVWFCLSEPLSREIPALNLAPPPMVWESETAHKDVGKTEPLMLIVILVVALVIGTAILIKIFWKSNTKGGHGNG